MFLLRGEKWDWALVFLTLPTHSFPLLPSLCIALDPELSLDWGMGRNIQDAVVVYFHTDRVKWVWVENGSALSAHNNPRADINI